VSSALPQPATADEPKPVRILLLLDVSGSMNERMSSGRTKFAAAKRALKQVADSLPPGTEVGLRVYGSTIAEPKSKNPKACTDSELVMPVGPLDRAKMYQAVDSFKAKGETPIAYALKKSIADLGDSGRRVLVLISDGEETCAKDPCPTARKLAESGVELQFNAVGFGVSGKARRQLRCIADAGNGAYYDASQTPDLTDAIRKITQRALRPFQISGIPVKGTEDPETAPQLATGQYADSHDASGVTRYYRIPRSPGSTVTASITSLVNPYHGQNIEGWNLELTTSDGRRCGTESPMSHSYKVTSVVAGAVSSDGSHQQTGGPCLTDPMLILSLSRKSYLGNKKSAPVEISVAEEPPITNLANLPEPLSSYDENASPVKIKAPAQTVLGGTAFSNAPALTPGTWTDSLATGETVVYRVRLETGQRLRVTADMPAPNSGWRLGWTDAIGPQLMIFAPSRVQLTKQTGVLQGTQTSTLTAVSPEIRVRNREVTHDQTRAASIAGDYYVAVLLDPVTTDPKGRVMKFRLRVAVEGEPEGQPVYASTAPSPSVSDVGPQASTTESPTSGDAGSTSPGGSITLPLVLLAAVAALGVGTGVVIGFRRGRRSV
jgi:Ca-activated chloride channel homolog